MSPISRILSAGKGRLIRTWPGLWKTTLVPGPECCTGLGYASCWQGKYADGTVEDDLDEPDRDDPQHAAGEPGAVLRALGRAGHGPPLHRRLSGHGHLCGEVQ